jgi:hypothetical protein
MTVKTVFGVLIGIVVAASIGFVAGRNEKNSTMIECTVTRVVRSNDQEPLAGKNPNIPYTVLSYSPSWKVFILPGIAGEDGQTVRISPQLLK